MDFPKKFNETSSNCDLLEELELMLTTKLFDKYYPLVIDPQGGFLCNIDYKWNFIDPQDKMIVTQSRHVWAPAKAAQFYPDQPKYCEAVYHGYKFLRNKMWDSKFGGFYFMRDPQGNFSEYLDFYDNKRTYGNAFAIYALAGAYDLTKDKEILDFAITSFDWIESNARDLNGRGYFQFLTREGKPYGTDEIKNAKSFDANEAQYKDQNSSIHLLEAYTELFRIWKDETVKTRLYDLLILIRDTITTEKGYMNLFFDQNWNPLSFRDTDEDTIKKNFGLDHVSFGHDYETAFLMLEASHVLGLQNDTKTLKTAKKMLDHSIENGWDKEYGGFYDGGYYFKGSDKCTIIHPVKNWWSQAEALNALLMMSKIFPDESKYYEYFVKELNYINEYIIDQENLGWYEWGIDRSPDQKQALKGRIWKACYHEGRSLMNCIKILSDESFHLHQTNHKFVELKQEMDQFIFHWKDIATKL